MTDYTLPPLPEHNGWNNELGKPYWFAVFVLQHGQQCAEAARAPLLDRLRGVCQTLVAAVGANGPCNAEDAAHKAVARIAELEAALAAKCEQPHGYAYRYNGLFGGTELRFNSGQEVNGGAPIEAVPYWLGAPPSQPVAETEVGDSDCREQDGCPTEKAVLQRFWRQQQKAQPVALPDGIVAAAKRYAELRDSVGSCSDGCCVVKRPTGMHTNGGCRCPDDRFKARKMMWAGQQLYEAIADAPAGEGVGDG